MSSSFNLTSSKVRNFKDKLARQSITAGGLMVLVALLLIFFYLLYVVVPIFESASIKVEKTYTLTQTANIVATGMEEQAEIAYVFTDKPELKFFYLRDNPEKQQVASAEVASFDFSSFGEVSSFGQSSPTNGVYAYGFSDGNVLLIKPKFSVSFPNNIRKITPSIEFPMGADLISVDDRQQSIQKIAVELNEEGVLIAAQTSDASLVIVKYYGEENFMTEEIEWSSESHIIEGVDTIDDLAVSFDLRQLYVRAGNQLTVYDVADIEEVSRLHQVEVNDENASVTAMTLLSGASSVLIGNDNGVISQWFEISSNEGRNLVNPRRFNNHAAVKNIRAEHFRKSFYVVGENGQLGTYFTTSENQLFNQKIATQIAQFSLAPRANKALFVENDKAVMLSISNEHPEVTWSALWQEVWYEGYSEPDYIWQSTSADDDFESKFSLVPISFGTIKAAMYAMLFAVPIALAAAIYTAYFMTPNMRRMVKPTIEIMEALPTVILGFLAGLWLAPIIEEYLPGIICLLLMLPVAVILAAFIWHTLPNKLKLSMNQGWDAMLLIPVVLLVGYVSFALSPHLEQVFFNGDTRLYITNELGIDFDQRNSLVVGIAMGFAVIPTIFSIAEDAIFSVPKQLSQGSLALGATTWQTLTRVVLLTASPGIFSAVMMGLGRAVGETMIVLMATGNTPIIDWNIFEGMRTLSANIAVEMPESEVGSSHYRILFLAAFVLFIFTFLFNTVAEFVRQRLREKYSSL